MRKETYIVLGVLQRIADAIQENQETMSRYASETKIEAVPSYLLLGLINEIKGDMSDEN